MFARITVGIYNGYPVDGMSALGELFPTFLIFG